MRRSQEIALIVIVFVWCSALVYLLHSQEPTMFNKQERRELDKAIFAMEELQKQNQQLREIAQQIDKVKISNNSATNEGNENSLRITKNRLKSCLENSRLTMNNVESTRTNGVSREHEVLVRRVENDLVEFWYTLERELIQLKQNPEPLESNINDIITRLGAQQRAALIDVEDLTSLNDGWRRKEARDLQELVQSRIRYLQNPKDCAASRRLVCKLNKGCGFGCQIHHVAYCFMVAYGTERTLVIDSSNWRYNHEGWEAVFKPVSDTCTKLPTSYANWRGEDASKNDLVIFLPIVDGVQNPPPYVPLGIPEELAPRLLRLHGNPSVWWVGQFIHHLMRPQRWLQDDLEAVEKASGFEKPILGIHVRRTDKVGTEAAFHGIDEYMKFAIAWYDKYDLRLSKEKPGTKAIRKIYLASDDSTVLPEARKKYPEYVFLGDTKISDTAGLNSRYSKSSLRGVLIDIILLSKCDYLSCTFSSQVCRVAYELMQTLHPDASAFFHSLDDIYYYGGQSGHEQRALYNHDARSGTQEISMKVGDVVGIAGNHWDGYSKGSNSRTNQNGLYPSYKMEEIFRLVKYPTYSKANSKR